MSSTFDLLSDCVNRAIELSVEVKFDAENITHIYPVALYTSILELIDDSLYLNREGPKPGIPILSRAILEAFVNLKNVISDAAYIDNIEFEWLRSWNQILTEAEAGNEYLVQITEAEDLQSNLEKNRTRLANLREKGVRQLQVLEKFQLAGLELEYRTIYGYMSGHSHSALQSLIGKHIDTSSGRPEVSAFVDWPIERFEIYLGTSCEILIQATELFHEYFDSEYAEQVAELRARVDAHKERISPA